MLDLNDGWQITNHEFMGVSVKREFEVVLYKTWRPFQMYPLIVYLLFSYFQIYRTPYKEFSAQSNPFACAGKFRQQIHPTTNKFPQ